MNMMNSRAASKSQDRAELINAFLRSIYNWMALGLGITALCAVFMTNTVAGQKLLIATSGFLPMGCMIATLIMAFVLGARINKMAASTATTFFITFSILMGIGLSPLLLVYTNASVTQAFVSAAGMFAATSLYALVTKRDLSGVGSFCMMGLFGLIIAMVVNFFFQSPMIDLALSCLGILIFTGLTAYETQLYKKMGETLPTDDSVAIHRATILGAFNLYMNFINLFIMLLRLVGDRR